MEENIIKLKGNENLLRLKIFDENDNDTGEELVFNLEDINLLTIYEKIIKEDEKNRLNLKNKLTIIDKKQDHEGKYLLSANEEAKVKALQEFYKKETEIYNMFLGERGVEKLLNGRKLSWTTLAEIDDIIINTIMPKMQENAEDIKKKIMEKYSKEAKRDDVIE